MCTSTVNGDYKATQNPNMSLMLLKANICNLTVSLQLTVGLQTPHTVSESLEMVMLSKGETLIMALGHANTGSTK